MRTALRRLGLAPGSRVFGGSEFDAATAERMGTLWDVPALTAAYRSALAVIEDSSARLARMAPEAAARETLRVGRTVIRSDRGDPGLPGAGARAVAKGAGRRLSGQRPTRRAFQSSNTSVSTSVLLCAP